MSRRRASSLDHPRDGPDPEEDPRRARPVHRGLGAGAELRPRRRRPGRRAGERRHRPRGPARRHRRGGRRPVPVGQGRPHADHAIFELGDFVLHAARRCARPSSPTRPSNAEPSEGQRHRLPTCIGPAYGERMADRPRQGAGPGQVLHHHSEHVGNGLSSSPSNTPAPWNGPASPTSPPTTTSAQHRLVTEHFGIESWSSSPLVDGALQTYHWASMYPDMVPRILPFQGRPSAPGTTTSSLSAKAALQADAAGRGLVHAPTDPGLRAFGRVYAGWGCRRLLRLEADITHMGYASLRTS